jgi:hypothetical protein
MASKRHYLNTLLEALRKITVSIADVTAEIRTECLLTVNARVLSSVVEVILCQHEVICF